MVGFTIFLHSATRSKVELRKASGCARRVCQQERLLGQCFDDKESSAESSTVSGLVSVVVSWETAVALMDLKRMYDALDLTGAICGNYGEGFGARVCVGPLVLKLGEKKVKKVRKIR